MGKCFPMALLSHRMCLVVLVDETLNFNHQLGARHPAVVRWRNSRASEQDNSFASPSRHGDSRYALRESVDHRANPPIAVMGAGISTPNPLELQTEVGRLQQGLHICVIAPNKRVRSVSLWRRRCNASAFIDRKTDHNLRSINLRTSGSVKPFATKWLTFVTSMPLYRDRLRNWIGNKRISWWFLSVAVVFARAWVDLP
uniref:Uncharacterized protein n=1 Tax=Hyaloperonospora arabidopsidis (strain Emoy2) TaxID=559515 RepID=M4BYU5_HYAAE